MSFNRFESPDVKNNSKVDTYLNLAKTEIELIVFTKLHELRKDNLFRIIIGQIDINLKINEFDALKEIVYNNVDILSISEIITDDSFLTAQFCIDGHSSHFVVYQGRHSVKNN